MFFHRLAVAREAHKLHDTPLPGWALVIDCIDGAATAVGTTIEDAWIVSVPHPTQISNIVKFDVRLRPVTLPGLLRPMSVSRACVFPYHLPAG